MRRNAGTFKVAITPQVTGEVAGEVTAVTPQVTPQVRAILKTASKPRTREELHKAAGIRDRKHFRTSFLKPLIEKGCLAMTIPGKPRSRLQRNVTTVTKANRTYEATNRSEEEIMP